MQRGSGGKHGVEMRANRDGWAASAPWPAADDISRRVGADRVESQLCESPSDPCAALDLTPRRGGDLRKGHLGLDDPRIVGGEAAAGIGEGVVRGPRRNPRTARGLRGAVTQQHRNPGIDAASIATTGATAPLAAGSRSRTVSPRERIRVHLRADATRMTSTAARKKAATAASRRSLKTWRAAMAAVAAPGGSTPRPRASLIVRACARKPRCGSGDAILSTPA